jgi:outer membrane protein TolC
MRTAGVLFVLFVASPVAAQSPRVALADLVNEALTRNPAIVAAQKQYDAARQRPAQARSLPDPMIEAGYTSSGNPLPGAGLGTEPIANIGFMVSQQLPYPGKRGLDASIASRAADADEQQIEAVRLSVIGRVKEAYYQLAAACEVTDVLSRNRDLLDTLLKVSENRYAAGLAAQQDVIRAQTELSILELRLERARQARRTQEGELNALLARPAGSAVGRPRDLQLTPFDLTLDSVVAATNEHAPALRRDQILLERSRLLVEAARKTYKPDFTLSGGYASMGSMPPMFEVRVGVTVPLQRARRAAAVAEQLDAADQARSAYDSTRLDLQARVEGEFEAASTSARLARLYRDTVLPQAHLAFESSMASYQAGKVDFLSVLANFGTVLDYETSYFDELASFHTAVSRLEELTGTPLVH